MVIVWLASLACYVSLRLVYVIGGVGFELLVIVGYLQFV